MVAAGAPVRVGSLFSGYGGLDFAVHEVFPDARTVWVSDVCKVNKDGTVGHHKVCRAPCTILAHRFPDAPNLGDITLIDWATVEPVEILTLGFPCQDVSTAGKQAGLKPGTRSGLWSHAAYAISQLRPSLVFIENVRGLLNAEAHSDLESRPDLLDGLRRRGGEPVLRAAGAVLGDLADLWYDAEWVTVPASGVGACHRRERVFIAAHPRD